MPTRFKFTKTKLKALKYAPTGKRQYYQDEETPGLGLTVTDKSKTFFVQYGRGRDLRRSALTDADAPVSTNRFQAKDKPSVQTITVEVARSRAKKALLGDEAPVEKKRRQATPDPVEVTIREAWEAYQQVNDTIRTSTVKRYGSSINSVFGDWMDRKLFSLTPKEILERHNAYEFKAQAKHAFRVLRAIFNHHIRIEQLDKANPVAIAFGGGKKAVKLTHKKRRKTYIKGKDMANWFDAVEVLPDVGQRTTWQGETARDLFLFQLFSGLRSSSECASLEWSQVDLRKKTVTYNLTKTTSEDDDDVVIPLNSEAIKILRRRPKGRYVFPSGGGWLDVTKTYINKVRTISGLMWTPYDSRRTFLRQGVKAKVPMLTLKRLVNHATAERDVTAGYIAPDLTDMRKHSERIALLILKKAKRSKQASSKVVAFK